MWQYYLKPSEYVLSREPSQVTTVLGSCVAVTFFEPASRTGGIFHALLPLRASYNRKPASKSTDDSLRFVDTSVEYLLERLAETGIKAADLQIKVFGGAEVLIPGQYGAAGESVGMQNIKAAFDALQARGLRVTASDVGGSRGRKLVFFTHTGEVLLKRLNADENGAIRKPGRMQGSGA